MGTQHSRGTQPFVSFDNNNNDTLIAQDVVVVEDFFIKEKNILGTLFLYEDLFDGLEKTLEVSAHLNGATSCFWASF